MPGHIYSWVHPSPHFPFHATRRADRNKKTPPPLLCLMLLCVSFKETQWLDGTACCTQCQDEPSLKVRLQWRFSMTIWKVMTWLLYWDVLLYLLYKSNKCLVYIALLYITDICAISLWSVAIFMCMWDARKAGPIMNETNNHHQINDISQIICFLFHILIYSLILC